MPCLSCQKSSSSPLNFLLNCISCHTSWHHRCHSPPVSDKDLITIIKAFNAEKHNPAAKLIWQCGICIKAKNSPNQRNPVAVKKAAPRHVAIPSITIDIDHDDDEIIALDGPPEVPKRNETTNPGVSSSSHAVIPQRSSNTQNALSLPKHQLSTGAPSDQLNPPSKDKKTRIIDDPFLVPDPSPCPSKPSQASSSTKPPFISELIDLTILSDEEMNAVGDDDALEYLTPPPTPAPITKQVVDIMEQVPQILTSNQVPPQLLPRDAVPDSATTTSPQPPNQLLIQWLNDRSTIAGVKPDLWARARLRRDRDVANKRFLGEDSVQPASSISPPSRRKCEARKLNQSSHSSSRATFFLSAGRWLREKQIKLE